MRTLGKRKGAVLIVVLGVLAVLALLATTFVTLQATEKQVARNYLDTVRAKMLAESGVSSAEAQLREYFPFQYFNTVNPNAPKAWKWWGKDSLPYETREPNPKDKLEETTNPSFAQEDEPIQNPTDTNVNPKQITVEGKKIGLSGYSGTGSYGALHGDIWTLKVSDLSGRIYVNDGLDGGVNGSVTKNLKRILNVLGSVLGKAGLGDMIVTNRPTSGYRSNQDLLKALGYDENLYALVKPHVTVYGWVDPNCVNPVPLSAGTANQTNLYPVQYYRGSPPVYRYTSSKRSTGIDYTRDALSGFPGTGFQIIGEGSGPSPGMGNALPPASASVYGMDQLNPQWIEVVKRAPVNINSATREVLVSLLTDIRGFFLADRRRNNPRWQGDLYLSFKQIETWAPGTTEGTEVGFIYGTIPIVGPGGTATNGISAFEIADEIIACRNGMTGKYGSYGPSGANSSIGGPFKNMVQFYAFVDHLVEAGLIQDTRGFGADYNLSNPTVTGYSVDGKLYPSPIQNRHFTIAAADAIKANFNPNCHLNCLNPDENMFLRVDKTSLLTMSTEFTFVPTGLFEVESLGRVIRPTDPSTTDCYLAANNVLMAQAKVTATYKLYDLYRETSFKDFYGGQLPNRTGAFETNSGYSLEIGPEVDNGLFPGTLGQPGTVDCEWGGYIAFPTVGGCQHSAAIKPHNTMWKTLSIGSGAHLNSLAHGHFQYDQDLHQHPFDAHEIASHDAADEKVWNWPGSVNGTDLGYRRPYNPTSGGAASAPYHRLAKSFRQTMDPSTGTVTSPPLPSFAPSDLRIDGTYSERNAGPAYYGFRGAEALWTTMVTGPATSGMISMWVKPSYYPELTGKMRYFWDFSRSHKVCGADVHVWPWTLAMYPSHYDVATQEGTHAAYWSNNVGHFQPASILFGAKQWHDDAGGWLSEIHEFGNCSTPLNHLDHDQKVCGTKTNPMQGHKWMNITAQWHLNGTDNNTETTHLWVNGSTAYSPSPAPNGPGPATYYTMTGGWGAGHDHFWHWDKHDSGEVNSMRLGSVSCIGDQVGQLCPVQTQPGIYKGNYSGDHTVDEFYCWNTNADADPRILWIRGRYYKPMDTTYGEGLFASQAISFVPSNTRTLPPPTSIPTPGGTGSGGASSLPSVTPQIRILGLSWTWFGEGYDTVTDSTKVTRTLWDYNTNTLYPASNGLERSPYNSILRAPSKGIVQTARDTKPQVLLGIRDGSVNYGPYDNDGFSAVRDVNGQIPVMQDPKNVKWFAQFKLGQAGLGTVLLATPYLDDVTVYWDDSRTHLLSYVFDNRTF